MSLTESHIATLALKKISGTLSAAESEQLSAWLSLSEENQRTFKRLTNLKDLHTDLQSWMELQEKAAFVSVPVVEDPQPPQGSPVHRVHFLRRGWLRYAAAIVLIAGIITAVIVASDRKKSSPPVLVAESSADILPGSDKAVLTLSDGTIIKLDTASAGQLAIQGGVTVMKLADGQIAYDLRGLQSKEIMWNTMSTPRGGQYQVVLPDGTRVWLNAISSITFPTAFTGDERKVKVSGEVYMEVSQNKAKPFLVDIDGKSTVEVLGTSFNINAYADEDNIKTTLVSGSVRINQKAILKPGQQATTAAKVFSDRQTDHQHAGIIITSNANLEQILAWKNGVFNFENADLKGLMRQIERWYNIRVKFEGNIPELEFRGEMNRAVPLSDILKYLNSLSLHCRLEGRTLIVKTKPES